MTFARITGDPLATTAQVLAFGFNAQGRVEVAPLQMALLQHSPAAFAAFGKQCRAGRIRAGMLWLWRESRPMLGFIVIRESPMGASRVRHAQNAALHLARTYRLEGITSVALAGLCTPEELPPIVEAMAYWLAGSALEIALYE
jgi:hypothetical protein